MPLVLVHGAGANGRVWEPLVAALGATPLGAEPIVALTLPGRPGGAGPALDRVEAVVDAIADQIPAGATVVGHSYGGAIALELALRGRAGALGLVDSGARLRVHPSILAAAAVGPVPMGFAFAPGFDAEAREYAARTADVPGDTALRDWQACDAFDRLARLGEIGVPTAVLAGEHDALTPEKYQRALVTGIRGARVAFLPGLGHMAPFERPAEVARALAALLPG